MRRRLTRVALRRPHRAHRVPTSASPPPSLSSRCVGPGALAGKNRTVCIPFSPNARKRPPSWQHPPEMHAFRDQDGNIPAPCIHFRAQSGDSGYMRANLAAKGPLSRRGTRNHARREDAASAARPFRGSGMRSGRTGFAPCGAGLACLPHARPLPSRLCPPPAFIAAVLHASRFAARIAPTHAAIRRAAHCGRDELSIGLFLPPSCCPRRPHRAHRCALAGTAWAPTRANRTPAPSQPSPAHPWSRLRPSAPRHPPRLTLPRGSRCGSGNSREMVR